LGNQRSMLAVGGGQPTRTRGEKKKKNWGEAVKEGSYPRIFRKGGGGNMRARLKMNKTRRGDNLAGPAT